VLFAQSSRSHGPGDVAFEKYVMMKKKWEGAKSQPPNLSSPLQAVTVPGQNSVQCAVPCSFDLPPVLTQLGNLSTPKPHQTCRHNPRFPHPPPPQSHSKTCPPPWLTRHFFCFSPTRQPSPRRPPLSLAASPTNQHAAPERSFSCREAAAAPEPEPSTPGGSTNTLSRRLPQLRSQEWRSLYPRWRWTRLTTRVSAEEV
jgi:hypothetical protein